MKISIGIGCIGSGVGQSVINACRLSRLPLRTVGLGANPFAYGAYDCDAHAPTPGIHDPGYVPALVEVCRAHGIRLVIPGTDDEALILAEAQEQLSAAGVTALAAGPALIRLCRDKERMSRELNPIADVFVRTLDPLTARGALASGALSFPLIAKPRGGFASRGIRILLDESDLDTIADSHVIQELAVPHQGDPNRDAYLRQIDQRVNPQLSEISIQLVTDRSGALIGRMASYNGLRNGIPIEILPYEHEHVWAVIDRLFQPLVGLGLRGPLNLQGRLTDHGLRLFEMNPRFTGITGLRALMGFNEVEACIRSWLELECPVPSLRVNPGTFGARQTADKAIPIDRNPEIRTLALRVNPRSQKSRPVLLVTGATGYLGRHLAQAASATHEIWTLDRDRRRARTVLAGLPALQAFDHHDLACGNLALGRVDVLLHCAFARPHRGEAEIAQSLALAQDLFTRCAQHQLPAVLNLSSQEVYGLKRPPPWSESLPPVPDTPYGMGKWAAELMLDAIRKHHPHSCVSSLRLATVAGGASGLGELDLLSRLVRQALAGKTIEVARGVQRIAYLDLRDAVSAVIATLRLPPTAWAPVYNVDADQAYGIADLANRVADRTAALLRRPRVPVVVTDSEFNRARGMDTTQLRSHTGWRPRFGIDDTIDALVARADAPPVDR